MKQLLILIVALALGSQNAFAQASGKIDSFRDKVLPQYSTYFSQAELSDNGQLQLLALDKYVQLTSGEKNGVMTKIAGSWRDSLVLVRYSTKSELWGWNEGTGITRLIDEWNKAVIPLAAAKTQTQKPVSHPWFLYLGYQVMGDNQKNINIAFNGRVGFYLLMNRWDFAGTFTLGVSGNTDVEGTTPYSNIGVMTRVHFPIKNTGFSPNIGLEVSSSSYGSTAPTVTPALVLGVSWFVGIGRIDIGVKIGNETSGMGGYTMYPGMGKFNKPVAK